MKSLKELLKENIEEHIEISEGLFGTSGKYVKHGWSNNPLVDSIIFFFIGSNKEESSKNETFKDLYKVFVNITKSLEDRIQKLGYKESESIDLSKKNEYKSPSKEVILKRLKECNFGKIKFDSANFGSNKVGQKIDNDESYVDFGKNPIVSVRVVDDKVTLGMLPVEGENDNFKIVAILRGCK